MSRNHALITEIMAEIIEMHDSVKGNATLKTLLGSEEKLQKMARKIIPQFISEEIKDADLEHRRYFKIWNDELRHEANKLKIDINDQDWPTITIYKIALNKLLDQ